MKLSIIFVLFFLLSNPATSQPLPNISNTVWIIDDLDYNWEVVYYEYREYFESDYIPESVIQFVVESFINSITVEFYDDYTFQISTYVNGTNGIYFNYGDQFYCKFHANISYTNETITGFLRYNSIDDTLIWTSENRTYLKYKKCIYNALKLKRLKT